jgi:hypothetical protein
MTRFAPPLAMVLQSILGLVSRDCLNSVTDKTTDSSRTHGDGTLKCDTEHRLWDTHSARLSFDSP